MVETPQKNKFVFRNKTKGFGYLSDLNSHRDFSIEHPKVQVMLRKLDLGKVKLPKTIDFRKEMTPVRDQQELGSCTAFAASALVEYFQLKTYKKYTPMSTRFTYKATRNLMRVTGDTGAYLRSVMGSIAIFGTPPEDYWEYIIEKFDEEPPPYCYAFAQNYQSTKYIRIDHPNASGDFTVNLMKKFIEKKVPIMFGFTVFDSFEQASYHGKVPFPSPEENVLGGHAVALCGYEDDILIENENTKQTTTGAFIFKNSWGFEWGNDGYGYLPYEYFNQKLADDCWTIISQEWLDHLPFQ